MGGPGGGGGMGGPGMGGPGMPPGGMRGGRGRGPGGGPGQGRGDPAMMGVSERMQIRMQGREMEVRVPMRWGDREQIQEYRFTTDGKKRENTLPGGSVSTSKTRWKKNHLVTTSESKGPMGEMWVIEDRELSEDGRTMTVRLTMKSSSMDWKRTLVYEKEDRSVEPGND